MSVIRSRRKPSGVQFVDTAFDLMAETVRLCLKAPKRLTFFLSVFLCREAYLCLSHVKKANSTFPTCKSEVQLRRNHLIEANNAVQALYSLIDVLWCFGCEALKGGEMENWLDMAEREAKLISGAKESDRKRYKDLKS